jgi:hypothetical protein
MHWRMTASLRQRILPAISFPQSTRKFLDEKTCQLIPLVNFGSTHPQLQRD